VGAFNVLFEGTMEANRVQRVVLIFRFARCFVLVSILSLC
jgi:hypothetical protein